MSKQKLHVNWQENPRQVISLVITNKITSPNLLVNMLFPGRMKETPLLVRHSFPMCMFVSPNLKNWTYIYLSLYYTMYLYYANSKDSTCWYNDLVLNNLEPLCSPGENRSHSQVWHKLHQYRCCMCHT